MQTETVERVEHDGLGARQAQPDLGVAVDLPAQPDDVGVDRLRCVEELTPGARSQPAPLAAASPNASSSNAVTLVGLRSGRW